MTDYLEGEDVDIVSDAHDLKEFESGSFDAVFTASTFEHIEHPWVAAGAIYRVLKHGGWAFVATHQTFPVHGYPHDYTRWTDKGLQSMFEWAGFRVETACMTDPCKIIPPDRITVWDPSAPAYLGVSVLAWKD
jgi:ubiquinone/menaquinone biosynthesis C-methylase UbiE